MTGDERQQLLQDLRCFHGEHRLVAANEKIHNASTYDDLPWLMTLLNDSDFMVREAAAWPISELAGASALSDLLVAYQRGFDEGQDNDSFSTALIELVEADKQVAREMLTHLTSSNNPALRENAKWLLEFC